MRRPIALATADRPEWLRFSLYCIGLATLSGIAFVVRALQILNVCATRPGPAESCHPIRTPGRVCTSLHSLFFRTD